MPREAIPQPDQTALQHLTAFQHHTHLAQGARSTMDVEYGSAAGHAFHAWGNHQAQLIHQPGLEQGAIGCAAAFQQQAADPQLAVQHLQCRYKIDLPLASEDVGDALLPQPCEVAFRNSLGEHDEQWLAAHLAAAPCDFPLASSTTAHASAFCRANQLCRSSEVSLAKG